VGDWRGVHDLAGKKAASFVISTSGDRIPPSRRGGLIGTPVRLSGHVGLSLDRGEDSSERSLHRSTSGDERSPLVRTAAVARALLAAEYELNIVSVVLLG
jgi:hypothetical protein